MPYQVIRVWNNGYTVDYGNKFNMVGAKDALTSSVLGDERPFSKAETSYAKQIDNIQVGEERKIYPAEEECGDYFVVKFIVPEVPGVKRPRDLPAEEEDVEDEPLEEKRSKFEISPVAWREVPTGYVGPLACIVKHSTDLVASCTQKRAEVLRDYTAYEKTISQNKGVGDLNQFSILARKIKNSEAVYFQNVRDFVSQMVRSNLGGAISLDEICKRTYLHRDEVHAFVLEEAISILFNLGDFLPDDLGWIFELIKELKSFSQQRFDAAFNRFDAAFNNLTPEFLLHDRIQKYWPDVIEMLPSIEFLWNAVPLSEPFSQPKLEILDLLMKRMGKDELEFINYLQKEDYSEPHIESFAFRHGTTVIACNAMIAFHEQFKNRDEQRRFFKMKIEQFPQHAQEHAHDLDDFERNLKTVRM